MKPGDEEALLAGLRVLREKSAGEGPPASLETALLTEFRRRRVRKESGLARQPLIWLGLAAAAVMIVVAVSSRPQPQPAIAVHAPIAPPVPAAAAEEPAPEVRPPVRQAKRAARRQKQLSAPVQEVATEFLPVPYAPVFTAEDRGQLVRVRLPRESMRSFGLPVNQDRIVQTVQADVLVGEDGIARAIRFVQ
ncbi:MAG: hypothetical protein ABJF23_30905 [Bryobacteraceae bacterium]